MTKFKKIRMVGDAPRNLEKSTLQLCGREVTKLTKLQSVSLTFVYNFPLKM